ncbi:MAG: hypothetical protein GC129_03550 [Proteobacteria bacterium]|nr:hypothetical protein [Pseudomonadota bacterium]
MAKKLIPYWVSTPARQALETLRNMPAAVLGTPSVEAALAQLLKESQQGVKAVVRDGVSFNLPARIREQCRATLNVTVELGHIALGPEGREGVERAANHCECRSGEVVSAALLVLLEMAEVRQGLATG